MRRPPCLGWPGVGQLCAQRVEPCPRGHCPWGLCQPGKRPSAFSFGFGVLMVCFSRLVSTGLPVPVCDRPAPACDPEAAHRRIPGWPRPPPCARELRQDWQRERVTSRSSAGGWAEVRRGHRHPALPGIHPRPSSPSSAPDFLLSSAPPRSPWEPTGRKPALRGCMNNRTEISPS